MEHQIKRLWGAIIALAYLAPAKALAADESIFGGADPSKFTDPAKFFNYEKGGILFDFVANLRSIFMLIIGIVAMLLIVWSGFLMITSGGDPEKIKKAKTTLTATIVGLLIILTAGIIVNMVITILN